MGKYRNIFFSEAIALIEPKLCINHWKVLYKLCVFYDDRNSKMTQDIVFTEDQLVFFITRWTIQALESLWFVFSELWWDVIVPLFLYSVSYGEMWLFPFFLYSVRCDCSPFFVFSELWWDVIVHFVDVSGITVSIFFFIICAFKW